MKVQDKHDPGGKVKTKLSEDIRGAASFSECGRYRRWLSRDWSLDGEVKSRILFIGMNPSTADESAQDPTITRESNFARMWGYNFYYKANVLDWRATNPNDLPQDLNVACSEQNIVEIKRMIEECDRVVLAYGRMHKRFKPATDRVINACRSSGKPLFCLGKNADGSAKHPLYLAKTTKLIPF